MKTLLAFFAGIITGLWIASQAKVINFPVFHNIEPIYPLLVGTAAVSIIMMRGKRGKKNRGKKA